MSAEVPRADGDRKPQPDPADRSGPALDGRLLELVSELAGEPWTDRPTCVHQTLGSIARVVDDHTSDAGRADLRPLASQLIGTSHLGLETPARLVAICVSTALASPDRQRITAHESRRMLAARQTALHLLRSRDAVPAPDAEPSEHEPRLRGAARWWLPVLGSVGLSEPLYRCFVAEAHAANAVTVIARASGADGDRRLRQLLTWCIAVSSSVERAPVATELTTALATELGVRELPDPRHRRRRPPTDSRRTPRPE